MEAKYVFILRHMHLNFKAKNFLLGKMPCSEHKFTQKKVGLLEESKERELIVLIKIMTENNFFFIKTENIYVND